ncbi:MAG: efflux RND transporter permease subunit, partial [Gammaproteobacteria bacterium]|nr:efflux RND transporter permease subunit [Gammaproteobacteria bacterium]
MGNEEKLGFSGRLAARFQESAITPLLALTGLLLGLLASGITPREEEPQIDVTFANIFVPFPGASAVEVENLVSGRMEQILAEVEGVEHTFSVSRPGMAILTVQFEVGQLRNPAIVRLYNAVESNDNWRAPGLGIMRPLIKPKGIDDVPIVSVTLWTEQPEFGAQELQRVAHTIEAEIKRVPGTRDVYTIGGPDNVVHVELDPQAMASYGLSLDALRGALTMGNVVAQAGSLVADNRQVPVTAGTFLSNASDIAELVVGVYDGKPVYLSDVASVSAGPDQPERYVSFGTGPGAADKSLPVGVIAPAVTLAIAKKPGTNAVDIADQVIQRVNQLKGVMIPDNVQTTITRNYGQTADDKASKLIQKLIFATASVVLLIGFTLGWREAVVVGAAVVLTLALTLFASWA